MESQISILVVATNGSILETILRLLNKIDGWSAAGVTSIGEVLAFCDEKVPNILLVGAGLGANDERAILEGVSKRYPDIKIIWHYGGGSGLLYAEIYQGLAS